MKVYLFVFLFVIGFCSCANENKKDGNDSSEQDSGAETANSDFWKIRNEGVTTTITLENIKLSSYLSPGGGEESSEFNLLCEADAENLRHGFLSINISKLEAPPPLIKDTTQPVTSTIHVKKAYLGLKCKADSAARLQLPPLDPGIYLITLETSGEKTEADGCQYTEAYGDSFVIHAGELETTTLSLNNNDVSEGMACP